MRETTQLVDDRLVQLFELSLDALCVAGFDGYLRFANPAFARLLGYTQGELLARPFMENVHPSDVDSVRAVLDDLAAGNDSVGFECRQVCSDGSVRWFEWRTSTRPEEGLVYGVARDVTERRAETEQLSALRRVATLVAEGTLPAMVFSSLAEEVKELLGARTSAITQLEADGAVRILANAGPETLALGTRIEWPGSVLVTAARTGLPTRKDDYKDATAGMPGIIRPLGVQSSVAAPIIVEGTLWGVIAVGSAHDRFPDGTESRLEEFTSLAATAVANAQSREAIGRLADEQAGLRRVATLVAQGAAPAEVFAAVSAEVDRVFHFDPAAIAGVVRFEPGPELVVVGVSKSVEAVPLGARFPPDELFAPTHVLRTERSARIRSDDVEKAGTEVAAFLRHHGYLSQVASPIVVDGRLWGAISVNSVREVPPDTEERLESFTELVGTAIANAESREALTELALEQAALRRVATLVARDAPPGEVFDSVASEVGKLLDTDITVVGRYDGDGAATAIGSWSALPGGVPVGTRSGVGGRNVLTIVAETESPARVDGYDDAWGEAAVIARRHGWRSSIAAPIIVSGRLWGVMLVATQRPEQFPGGAETRLSGFTDLVATAIANAESREARAVLTEEQATLRRIATLVAQVVQPEEVFAAVIEETAATFGVITCVERFEHDPPGVILVGVSEESQVPVGARWELAHGLASAEVYRTGRSARLGADGDWSSRGGPVAEEVRRLGIVSQVSCPIVVEGSLWGVITLNAREELPPDTEQRLEKFTDLVTTAIANAESKAELTASRRRIVGAADEERRRIERDLHDGIQQRLIALTFRAGAMARGRARELPGIAAELSEGLTQVSDELREVARGIHPSILTEAGLGPALRALARRSSVPVDVDIRLDERMPAPVEAAAYYVASEALTNVAKHAHANAVELNATAQEGTLTLEVRDDGIGGVDAGRGSGIVGLTDRVEALDGTISVASPPRGGTTLSIRLPITR